jgi:hypothetical protein
MSRACHAAPLPDAEVDMHMTVGMPLVLTFEPQRNELPKAEE